MEFKAKVLGVLDIAMLHPTYAKALGLQSIDAADAAKVRIIRQGDRLCLFSETARVEKIDLSSAAGIHG